MLWLENNLRNRYDSNRTRLATPNGINAAIRVPIFGASGAPQANKTAIEVKTEYVPVIAARTPTIKPRMRLTVVLSA
jgi:hypothetical protein